MRAFEFETFRISVEEVGIEAGQTVWRIFLEAPGAKPIGLISFGGSSEAAIALDLIQDMRRIFAIGVNPYVKAELKRDPEIDEAEERKRAAALFAVAQAVDNDDIASAEMSLQVEAVAPEERGAMEVLQKTFSRDFDFGNVKISVRPSTMAPGGQIWFSILMEGKNVRDEDLMLRPPAYLTSRVAGDHIKVIRRVLEWGVDRAIDHHLKVNYLGDEFRPQVEEYIHKLDQVGRTLGDAELARIEAGLEEEADREAGEREGIIRGFKETEEVRALKALEAREREIEDRIKELKSKRGLKT